MKRAIQWSRPVRGKYGDVTRTSKCGKYKIVTREMASGGNGCWNAREYEPQKADGTRIGRFAQDTLELARDMIESDNNPNWEPDC